MSSSGTGFYGRDVAHVHDAGHGDYARAAAPDLLRRLHEAGLDGGLVVDLGCGSGIWARTLLDAGLDVLGIDLSADLLAIARERAPEGRFVQASVLDAGLPPCAAVTAMSEVVNYTADPRVGRPALTTLIRRVHDALHAGGLLLFDALAPGFEPPARRTWREDEDWVVLSALTDDAEDPRVRPPAGDRLPPLGRRRLGAQRRSPPARPARAGRGPLGPPCGGLRRGRGARRVGRPPARAAPRHVAFAARRAAAG